MDARQYLEQVRDLHATIIAMQLRLQEQQHVIDLLRTPPCDGMPHAAGDGKALENAVVEHMELMDEYTGELLRWTALRKQALDMLDRARAVLSDGRPHAIGTLQLDVLEMHYVDRMSFPRIQKEMRRRCGMYYAESTYKWYRDQAIEWLGYSTDNDGMPLVPIVSE